MRVSLPVSKKFMPLMILSLLVGAIMQPLNVFIGFCLGDGRYFIFAVALGFSIILTAISEYIWWLVMSHLKEGK